MDEKETRAPGSLGAQGVDETVLPEGDPAGAGEPPVQKATMKQRIAAAIAAAVVIVITIAYIYAIYTGALFSR